MSADKISIIHKYARKRKIRFKKHALIRVVERNIKIHEIEEALERSTIITSYPEDAPLESHLLLGYTRNKKPLHIVTAVDETDQYIWIITVYEPDRKRWNDSLTKRKNP